MNGEDSQFTDEDMKELFLDQLGSMYHHVKGENPVMNVGGSGGSNSADVEEDCNNSKNEITMAGHLPPPPAAIPIFQFSMQSSPHILTGPPDNHHASDDFPHYNHLYHHPNAMIPQGMKSAHHTMLMHPHIPGTPPDTPPVNNNSPSPQSIYQMDPVQQYTSHIQMPKSSPRPPSDAAYLDEVLWHMQSSLARPEPIDLRHNCGGGGGSDSVSEIHKWNAMQRQQYQQTSVITAASKRIYQTDYTAAAAATAVHRPYLESVINPSLSNATAGVCKSTGMPIKTVIRNGRNGSRNELPQDIGSGSESSCIDDDTLVNLSVRELNCRLKGKTRDAISKWKSKRRTLKNRGYARNCRTKRVMQKDHLEAECHQLREQMAAHQNQINKLTQEVVMYKQKYEHLLRSQQPCIMENPNQSSNSGRYVQSIAA